MTSRLEEAIKRLPPEKVEQVVHYAESLVKQLGAPPEQPKFLRLDWVGAAAHAYPEHASGVEAAHAAAQLIRDALDRASSR